MNELQKTIKQSELKVYELKNPAQLEQMAGVLKRYIVKNGLYINIKGKNYAYVDGWQFAGTLLGLSPFVESVENLSTPQETKWRANVKLIAKNGTIVSNGFAICSSKEFLKKTFDEYAILSMAQTRAIGKAYRNLVGWVIKLAGYESTPSEEMAKMGESYEVPKKAEEPTVQLLECHGAGKTGCQNGARLTEQELSYSKRIYGKPLCRACQKLATRLKK